MEGDIHPREEKPKIVIFGRDFAKMPCFRSSWLYGITSGIGAGLLTFMFTSRIPLASHMMMGTMCTVSLSCFVVCRYRFARDEAIAMRIRGLMQDAMSGHGRHEQESIDEINKLIDA